MKKQLISLVALAGFAMGATLAYGAAGSNGGGIVGSKHDMNVWLNGTGANAAAADTDGRVCAYCHTPHHAADPTQTADTTTVDPTTGASTTYTYNVYVPLWSRAVPSGPYDSYVSATFNPGADGRIYDNMIGPSRLCMSCHDGNIAADAYYGNTGSAATVKGDDTINMFGSGHIAVASSFGLSNDHPVGMDYDEYQADTRYELNPSASSTFGGGKAVADVLFSTNGKKIMTCASCHDVHNGPAVGNTAPTSGRGYFLYGPQAGSAFCLTCHNKNS